MLAFVKPGLGADSLRCAARPKTPGADSRGVDNTGARAAEQQTGTPTGTATSITTPPPGPTPTATPKPLAQADPAKAASLVEDGKTRFLKSDLVGAEGAFIDAIAADPSNLQAYIGLTNVYLYLPQRLATSPEHSRSGRQISTRRWRCPGLSRLGATRRASF